MIPIVKKVVKVPIVKKVVRRVGHCLYYYWLAACLGSWRTQGGSLCLMSYQPTGQMKESTH